MKSTIVIKVNHDFVLMINKIDLVPFIESGEPACSHSNSANTNCSGINVNPRALFGGPTRPTRLFFVFSYVDTYSFLIDLFSNRYSSNNTRRPYEISSMPLTGEKLRGGSTWIP